MSRWRRVRLVDLCEAHVDCVNRTAPVVEGPARYKMIRTTNVRGGFIDTTDVKYVTEETYRIWTRRLVPRRGDIVLTREAPLGGVGMVRTDESIFLGQRLYHFRAHPKLADANFLLFALMGPDLQEQIRSYGSGSTVEHMRLPDIEKLELNAPDLPEQRRIGQLLSNYDDLIVNCERRIKVLDEMARSLYREWFVELRYPGRRGDGKLAAGWRRTVAGDVADEVRRNVPKGDIGSAVYVGLEHIPRRSLALDSWEVVAELGSNKLQFEAGEVLFGKIRPYFHKVAVAPCAGVCSADTFVIRPCDPSMYGFMVGLVSNDEFVAHASATANGAKMPRANWDVMMQFPVSIPPKELLSRFDDLMRPWLDEQRNLVARMRNLREARDLLLPRLLADQLRVAEAA